MNDIKMNDIKTVMESLTQVMKTQLTIMNMLRDRILDLEHKMELLEKRYCNQPHKENEDEE